LTSILSSPVRHHRSKLGAICLYRSGKAIQKAACIRRYVQLPTAVRVVFSICSSFYSPFRNRVTGRSSP
jgi:hypothetical protein